MKEKVLLFVICLLLVIGIGKVFALLDQHEYNRALDRCGNKDNVVEKYTKEGDKYYTCKVDK